MDIKAVYFFTIFYARWNLIKGCKEGNKDVGVCLHVYLERDFLSLEKIVFPPPSDDRYKRSYAQRKHNFKNGIKPTEENAPGEYGHRDWIEGPELEDHCGRLNEVLKCFEEVLIDCDSGYHFFRYRHLLYALSRTHHFLCATPQTRKDRFLRFLKTIQCVEEARRNEMSCHRHNVSSIVWNKILRVEVGIEICDSLSTQRSCLLENGYIHKYCMSLEREELYSDVSNYFLSIWCQFPVHPKLVNMEGLSPGEQPRSELSMSLGFPSCFLFISLFHMPVR